MNARNAYAYEPGDYVAWYFGPVQYRGHVVRIRPSCDEIVVRSTSGVEWNLEADQIERLGSLPTDEIREVEA